ncbi:MAG: hypothetical protein Q4D45_10275 [Lachnospiraceae bacterium]|nr:hypothetical protein [Lachnospiraceae bacterium]
MNSDFHYFDGFKLRTLFAVILFLGMIAANHLYTNESEKNALVQAAAYTGRSDFITKTFAFDQKGTFLIYIRDYTLLIKHRLFNS